jgi:hypothetical protein
VSQEPKITLHGTKVFGRHVCYPPFIRDFRVSLLNEYHRVMRLHFTTHLGPYEFQRAVVEDISVTEAHRKLL